MKKIAFLLIGLSCSINAFGDNAIYNSPYDFNSYEQMGENTYCPGKDELNQEQLLQAGWTINNYTPISITDSTTVQRHISPYAMGHSLADITCNYGSNAIVIKRTYKEGNPPYPDATNIGRDLSNGRNVWQYDCSTTVGNVHQECAWAFYHRHGKTVAEVGSVIARCIALSPVTMPYA